MKRDHDLIFTPSSPEHQPPDQPPAARSAPAKRARQSTAQRQLRETEERYHALLAALTQVFWTTNAEGLADRDMSAWCAYTGQGEEEARGWGWLRAIHPDDRERVQHLWS
ncbi:MAG: hypothetical protein IVW57_01495, partial [Ktedonobacterales bacterium]|nr:hypothetical protein [Ktedonobacterales bacterium]